MKRMRILSAVLAAVMMLSLFAGCAKRDADKQMKPDGSGAAETGAELSSFTKNTAEGQFEPVGDNGNRFGRVESRMDEDGNPVYAIALNTKFSGFEGSGSYTYCKALQYYFEISNLSSEEVEDTGDLNCVGVADAEGHVIVPAKYAAVVELNERYIRAYQVSKEVENEEEALLVLPGADGEKYYQGSWYIFDVLDASEAVAVGTKSYQATADGGELTYYGDDGIEQHISSSIQDRRQITENTYILENEKAGLLYTEDGRFVRMFSREGFYLMNETVADDSKTYLIAEKQDEENGSEYVLMTENGEIASAPLPDKPNRIADVVIYLENGSEVSFDGKQSEAASGDVVS